MGRKEIAVFAQSLRTGGALAIYAQFLSHLKDHCSDDIHWTVVADASMPRTDDPRVTFLTLDTRRWSRRLAVDWLSAGRFLKSNGKWPDVVVSLQNTGVLSLREVPQVVYYHQALPFYKHRWNLLKKDERKLFLYKNIYPFFVKISLTPHTDVVVQTPSVADAFQRRYSFPQDRIHVLFPDVETIDVSSVEPFGFQEGTVNFIYPADAHSYKEHATLVKAMERLKQRSAEVCRSVRIYFTTACDAMPEVRGMIDRSGLGESFVFVGRVPHRQLLEMYKSSDALLFPSAIETIGLPLLEASRFGLPVIVSDLGYAHDVLAGYEGVRFVPAYDFDAWADRIAEVVRHRGKYPASQPEESSWDRFFSLVTDLT